MKQIKYITLLFLAIGSSLYAQGPKPAPPQSEPILITGAVAHLGNGEVIENAAIGFTDGKITLVGKAEEGTALAGHRVIDATGKHVYPGFILANSQLGLEEVSSVRAMSDSDERGEVNPNIRSVISYNTDSEFIPTMRFNGVLLAESTPQGGTVSGTSSVMEMEGWNWEDAAHTMDIGIHLNWPQRNKRTFDFATFTRKSEANKDYPKDVRKLRDHLADAVSFGKLSNPHRNLKLESMQGLFDGSKILFIHAEQAKEAIESIRLAQESGVQKIVLVGGSSSLHIAQFLVDNKIKLIIPPTHQLPDRPDDPIDLPYQLPHLLTQAGVEVSLSHSGMLAGARNLPFYAGTAVAYGMEKEEALKLITLNPARALGIDDRVGTLEVGKDATLFISEGDALDIRTSIVQNAFISGKEVVLDAKQQKLWKMYEEKYGDN